MGIQINGVTDSISAVDGSLSLTGAELASVGGINVSGVVTATTYIVGSGSTSAPSISPSGDSNTGIFFPSADTIAFGEGGAEVARFDSSGRFSIGTTSPSQPFVVSNGGAAGLEIDPNGVDSGSTIQGYNRSTSAFVPVTMLGSHLAFRSGSSPTERARIDTSGRFGIGTTAPIAQTHIMLSDVTGYTSPSNDGFVLERGGGNDVAISIATDNTRNGYLIFADGDSANPAWVGYDHSVNAMSFRVNASERARIDSSGRLLVGTSSWSSSDKLVVRGNTSGDDEARFSLVRGTVPAADQNIGVLHFQQGSGNEGARITALRDGGTWTAGSSHPSRLTFSTTADGASSPTERVRITQQGFFKATNTNSYYGSSNTFHEIRSGESNSEILYITHTASTNPYGITMRFTGAAPNDSTRYFLTCVDSSATRMQIYSNGGIANYQANNANLSDRNAKKDITPAAGTWDCIKEWEIVNYRYKDQPDDADLNLGVIAQQVAESCPEVITVFEEAKDDQPEKLGVKEQQMYWMAIKALQEAQERIEALETENSTLKSQNDSILARLDAAGI